MKRFFTFIILTIFIFWVVPLENTAQASANSVYDMIENENKTEVKTNKKEQQPKISVVSSLVKFSLSFVAVIALMYLVMKWLKKKATHRQSGLFHHVGGHSLGNQKTLQMVMMGETLYLLGVGEDVQLIRMIPPGNEQTEILQSFSIQESAKTKKWEKTFLSQIDEIKGGK